MAASEAFGSAMKLAVTILVFCVAALLALGMVMLYSSSMTQAGARYLILQLLWCALGLVLCVMAPAPAYNVTVDGKAADQTSTNPAAAAQRGRACQQGQEDYTQQLLQPHLVSPHAQGESYAWRVRYGCRVKISRLRVRIPHRNAFRNHEGYCSHGFGRGTA